MRLAFFFSTLAVLGSSMFGASAASLNIGSMGDTFPTYTDAAGIKVTYNNGPQTIGGESNGRRPSRGNPNLSINPHLAMVAGDTVTIDFSGTAQGASNITFTFYDLDTENGAQENVVVQAQGGGSQFVGAQVDLNDALSVGVNTGGSFLPAGGAKGIITLVSPAGGSSFAFSFDYTVGGPIPEPSSALLGVLGMVCYFRRRR